MENFLLTIPAHLYSRDITILLLGTFFEMIKPVDFQVQAFLQDMLLAQNPRQLCDVFSMYAVGPWRAGVYPVSLALHRSLNKVSQT